MPDGRLDNPAAPKRRSDADSGYDHLGSQVARDLGQERGRALETITALATSSLDLSDVASRALASASDYLKVSAASLWLFDERRELLCPYDAVGFPSEFFEDFSEGLAPVKFHWGFYAFIDQVVEFLAA